jgi:tetratricopeptide (TPR) repeat protein
VRDPSLGWTSFVGREAELAALDELVAAKRWVAIIGPPGVGKTRLAAEVLRQRDSVWWVALAGVTGADAAVSAIAQALELPMSSAGELAAAIAHRGPAVLALDDIDALGGAANDLVGTLLRGAPALHVVTTALRRGGVGESSFDVAPLPPVDASRLFVERARAVRRDFELAGHETAVGAVTRVLDGLPLAIELAAARMRVLTPEQLAREPNPLLGNAEPLRAALDACWRGLSDRERTALAQLSVFRGGFDLDAARAIVELDPLYATLRVAARPGEAGACGVDAVIADLRDASLLAVVEDESRAGRASGPLGLRFAMLELVREYVAAQLADPAPVRSRHAAHVLARTRAWVAALDRTGGARARRRIALERDNLLAIVGGDDRRAGLDAACVLAWAGLATGPYDELAEVLVRALDAAGDDVASELRAEAWWLREEMLRQAGRAGEAEIALTRFRMIATDPIARARAAYAAAALSFARGDLDAARIGYVEAIERAGSETSLVVRALCDLGTVEINLDDFDIGRSHFEAALAAAQASQNERGEGRARAGLGTTALRAGHLDLACAQLERARQLHRDADDRRSEAIACGYLAVAAQLRRDSAHAEAGFREALELARWMGHRLIEAITLGYLGVTEHALGRLDDAQHTQEQALAAFRRLANRPYEALALARLGAVLADRGDADAATSMLDAADAIDHGDREIAAVARVCRGHLELSRRGATRALERLATADHGPLDARLQATALRRLLTALDVRDEPFEIGARGRWFRAPDGKRVGLERRGAPSRILAYLVEQRLAAPAKVVPTEQIFAHGWPNERASADAAAQRVYTAIWTLRRLGLRDVIVRVADGYFVDPKVPVVTRDE